MSFGFFDKIIREGLLAAGLASVLWAYVVSFLPPRFGVDFFYNVYLNVMRKRAAVFLGELAGRIGQIRPASVAGILIAAVIIGQAALTKALGCGQAITFGGVTAIFTGKASGWFESLAFAMISLALLWSQLSFVALALHRRLGYDPDGVTKALSGLTWPLSGFGMRTSLGVSAAVLSISTIAAASIVPPESFPGISGWLKLILLSLSDVLGVISNIIIAAFLVSLFSLVGFAVETNRMANSVIRVFQNAFFPYSIRFGMVDFSPLVLIIILRLLRQAAANLII